MLIYPVRVSAVVNEETEISFKIHVYENETQFTFSAPETLSLLTVKKNSEGYKAQYDGMVTIIDRGSILAVDSLDRAIKTINTSESCAQRDENGENVLLFSIDGNNVLVYYDNELKTIKKIISEANGQSFTYEILSVVNMQT